MTNRHTRKLELAFGCHLAAFSLMSSAAEPDRLLPTAQQSRVTVAAVQDGRAVNLTLDNQSDLVLTSAEVICYAQETPERRECRTGLFNYSREVQESVLRSFPESAEQLKASWGKCYGLARPATILKKTFDVKIRPGKSLQIYAEISAGPRVGDCEVADPRGREKQWHELR